MAARHLRSLLLAVALAAVLGPNVPVASAGATFVLDVGAPGDADRASVAFLDEIVLLSGPLGDGTRDWRTVDEGGYLYFRVRPDGVALAPNGVPFQDAIIDVDFQDVVDEANCATVQSTRAYCRPRLATRLNYGDDPQLTWHAIGGIGGLNSGQWTRTSIFLEATPWQTLRAIDGYFEFYLFYPNQLGAYRPLPIDAINLRLVDRSTFDAEREADRAARTLVRSDHVEDHPLDPVLADQPYVVFSQGYLAKIYPNTVPAPEWVTDTLRTFEVAGEREPITFAVHAVRDVHGISVRATDLVSDRGAIPAASVALNLVGYADKRWGYGYDRMYGQNPWVLDDMAVFDVPAGTNRQVWATIGVPADAAPGDYTGSLVLTAEDAPGTTIQVRLMVYDVDLAQPAATPYVYHSPYLRGKYFAPRRSTAARDMAAHDINPIIYLDAEIDLLDYSVDVRDLPEELAEFQALGILPPRPRVGIFDNADALWRQLCPGVPVFTATCTDFDAAYVNVLDAYEAEFAAFGVVPSLSFTDEPGNDPVRRIRSNYLHRLTLGAGMTTWVTYYPRCEEPLAGYHLTFADLVTDAEPSVPEWLLRAPGLRGYWDFTDSASDRSPYANDGTLMGGARVEDGALVLPTGGAVMRVPDADALDLTDAATLSLWIKPSACPTDYARQPLSKWAGTTGANYVLYFFGDYDGQRPDDQGVLQMYADAGGRWTTVSSRARLDCAGGLDRWYNVVWSYDAGVGGTLLFNSVPFAGTQVGRLATNAAPLEIGRIPGAVDEVLLLDRALTDAERLDLARTVNASYDRDQVARLVLDVPPGTAVPSTLTFSIDDGQRAPDALETTKTIEVNGRSAWTSRGINPRNALVTVDLAPFLVTGSPNRLVFSVANGDARQEDVRLYFVEDAWRNATWRIETSPNWHAAFQPDDSGALGPMDPNLDDRVYALSYVSGAEIDRTRAAGDTFSYYTTYPATQPVIVNNRFLNGLYASAVGAKGVYVYAYGDWGAQPWDDTEPSYVEQIGNDTARRSQNNYELVMPSWDDRVYDTVVYEALREGIEDSRIVAALERAIATHPGVRADAARAYLRDLFTRVSRDYAPRYMSYAPDGPIDRYADRSGEMLTDLAGDPDAYGFFDTVRRRMIDHIVALEALGPTPPPCYVPFAARSGTSRGTRATGRDDSGVPAAEPRPDQLPLPGKAWVLTQVDVEVTQGPVNDLVRRQTFNPDHASDGAAYDVDLSTLWPSVTGTAHMQMSLSAGYPSVLKRDLPYTFTAQGTFSIATKDVGGMTTDRVNAEFFVYHHPRCGWAEHDKKGVANKTVTHADSVECTYPKVTGIYAEEVQYALNLQEDLYFVGGLPPMKDTAPRHNLTLLLRYRKVPVTGLATFVVKNTDDKKIGRASDDVEVEVRVVDGDGDPLPGRRVTIEAARACLDLHQTRQPRSFTTDTQGIARQHLAETEPGAYDYTATVDGKPVAGTYRVVWLGDADRRRSSVKVTPGVVWANDEDAVAVEVTARDACDRVPHKADESLPVVLTINGPERWRVPPEGTEAPRTDPSGVARFPAVTFDAAGDYQVGAEVIGDPVDPVKVVAEAPPKVEQVEVRQANMDLSEADLVAGRDTLVRVYVANRSATRSVQVTGRVRVLQPGGGQSGSGQHLDAGTVRLAPKAASAKDDYASTLNFRLPGAMVRTTNSLEIRLAPAESRRDYHPDVALDFLRQPSPVTVGYIVQTHNGVKPDASLAPTVARWLAALYPADVRFFRLNWPVSEHQPGVGGRPGPENTSLRELRDLRSQFGVDRLVDFVGPGGGASAGPYLPVDGRCPEILGVVWIGQNAATLGQIGQEAPHELGHSFCLFHNRKGAMSPADPNQDPNAPVQLDGPGFDLEHARLRLMKVADTWDFMNKAQDVGRQPVNDHVWISAYRWRELLGKVDQYKAVSGLLAGSGDSGGGDSGRVSGDPLRTAAGSGALLVQGSVRADGTATLDPVMPAPRASAPVPSGRYCLVSRDRTDRDLYRTCFDVGFVDGQTGEAMDGVPFSRAIPVLPDSQSLVLTKDGAVLARLARSGQPPRVAIQSPVPGETWTGRRTVAWTGADDDGDALRYLVRYSIDGGASWQPLAVDQVATTLDVDADQMPGGDAVILQVAVSDGFNTASADVQPIHVGWKAPTVTILSPVDGATLGATDAIDLFGTAEDRQDGWLGDGALAWTSDRAGTLGAGRHAWVTSLAPGAHRVTLAATDSRGASGSASVTIQVRGSRLYVPFVARLFDRARAPVPTAPMPTATKTSWASATPTATPTPSATSSAPGTVVLDGILTTGVDQGHMRMAFAPGETVRLLLDVTNSGTAAVDAELAYEVVGHGGYFAEGLSWTGTVSVLPGSHGYSIERTVPGDIPSGAYTFMGTLTTPRDVMSLSAELYIASALLDADDFADPTSGWPEVDSGDTAVGYLDGEYRILIRTASMGNRSASPVAATDCALEADTRFAGGVAGAAALMFDLTSDGSYTIYGVSTDGRYGLFQHVGSGWQTVVPWTPSPSVRTGGATNHLMIVRFGTDVRLYANGQAIGTVTVPAPASGWTGFFAEGWQAGLDGRFDNWRAYGSPRTASRQTRQISAVARRRGNPSGVVE
jgi:hypothetical protein